MVRCVLESAQGCVVYRSPAVEHKMWLTSRELNVKYIAKVERFINLYSNSCCFISCLSKLKLKVRNGVWVHNVGC